jgi:hypothetical protein
MLFLIASGSFVIRTTINITAVIFYGSSLFCMGWGLIGSLYYVSFAKEIKTQIQSLIKVTFVSLLVRCALVFVRSLCLGVFVVPSVVGPLPTT